MTQRAARMTDERCLVGVPGGRRRLDALVEVFDPGRLTQARQALSWTKKRLADELGISAAAVGQYEAGVIRPRAEQLERIAQLLDVPADYFAVGRPRADVDAAACHFRSLRSMRAYERERAVTYVEQLWELCHALELRVKLPEADLPDLSASDALDEAEGSCPAPSAPAEAARLVRRRWGLGSDRVSHLVRTLEAHGILVGLLPFSDARRVDAFSTSHTPRPVMVLASDKTDVYRHRFTAGHELGHLLLHRNAQPGDVRHEREADQFAAEFLVPAARIEAHLPRRIDFPRLISLQSYWGVSVEALLYRSRELGVMSDATHRRARIKLSELRTHGVVRTEDTANFPGEQPQLLHRAALACGDPIAELAEELAWSPARVQALLGRPPGKPTLTVVP
jgi:Zn-dependent peptidase ImmA (M78 family)/transcriptional regulator with XRE-family HTH domain